MTRMFVKESQSGWQTAAGSICFCCLPWGYCDWIRYLSYQGGQLWAWLLFPLCISWKRLCKRKSYGIIWLSCYTGNNEIYRRHSHPEYTICILIKVIGFSADWDRRCIVLSRCSGKWHRFWRRDFWIEHSEINSNFINTCQSSVYFLTECKKWENTLIENLLKSHDR